MLKRRELADDQLEAAAGGDLLISYIYSLIAGTTVVTRVGCDEDEYEN